MKITHKKITASTILGSSVVVPSPFDQYYDAASEDEVADYTGYDPKNGELTPCESAEGYDIVHLGWVIAKPEYQDALSAAGLDVVEVISSGWDSNKPMLAYCVGKKVFPVEESDMPEVDRPTDFDDEEYAFGDDPVAGIAAMLGISYEDADRIFDWYDAEGVTADFDSIREFLDYINDDIENLLIAMDDEDPEFAAKLRDQIGGESIESCNQIPVDSATKTGLEYWYYSRHGMGPGTIPKGVQVLDWYEEGYKTWMLLDQVLNTNELNEYELKEETPPAGSVTHNGTVIEGCSEVTSSECVRVAEDEDKISYVVSSTEADEKSAESSSKLTSVEAASDDVRINNLRDAYLDPDNDNDIETRNASEILEEQGDEIIDISLSDVIVVVEPNTSWKLEDEHCLEGYETDNISLDRIEEDFEFVFSWAVPAAQGRYRITANVSLTYEPAFDAFGNIEYEFNPEKSTVYPIDTQPAGKDFNQPSEETIEESTQVEETTQIEASGESMMTEADLDNAILNGRPFDLASFKKYKMSGPSSDAVRADEVTVGDVITVTETSEEVNIGTKVKVLAINDPAVDWADYTFRVEVVSLPDDRQQIQVGDVIDMHFFADEYIGPRNQTDNSTI